MLRQSVAGSAAHLHVDLPGPVLVFRLDGLHQRLPHRHLVVVVRHLDAHVTRHVQLQRQRTIHTGAYIEHRRPCTKRAAMRQAVR